MADLIIKPTSGGNLVLQDEGGDAALTIDTAGRLVGAGGLRSQQILTSGTTYTRPAGISTIKVYCTGGGGGGGAKGGSHDCGAGGGGAGTAIHIYDVSSTTSITYAIGAGGTSGDATSLSTDGGNGGTTTFQGPGQTITGTGGTGGKHGNNGANAGGPPGVGTGGSATLKLTGDSGQGGRDSGTVVTFVPAGKGGASYWGGGGAAGGHHHSTGTAGQHGGGGAGGRDAGGSTAADSTAGGAGIIVVEEYS